MLNGQWLDTLMQRLRLAYAGRFPPKGLPEADIRADWGRELSGLSAPELKHGLAHLPKDWPPTAMQFRELCHIPPEPTPLPPPGPAKVIAAPAVTATLKGFVAEKKQGMKTIGDANANPKRWAYQLKAREEAGEDLSAHQRRMWREALFWLNREESNDENVA